MLSNSVLIRILSIELIYCMTYFIVGINSHFARSSIQNVCHCSLLKPGCPHSANNAPWRSLRTGNRSLIICVAIADSPSLKSFLESLHESSMGSIFLVADSRSPVQPILCPGTTGSTQDSYGHVDHLRTSVSPVKDRSPTPATVVSRDAL